MASGTIDFVIGLNQLVGHLFFRCLRVMAVPLVLFSLPGGVAGLGDLKRVGQIGDETIGIFLFCAVRAISTWLAIVARREGERMEIGQA